MQKKVVLALLIAVLLTGGVFAEGFSLSGGGGMLLDFSGNNGVEAGNYYVGARNLSFGVYGFFDATYVEVDFSFAYGKITGVGEGNGASEVASYINGNVMQFGLSLLGKYPINLSSFTFFPLLGFNYNMVISYSQEGYSYPKPGDMNQFGLLAGVGSDFGLTDSLYLRTEGMFQIRFACKYMQDLADLANAYGLNASTTLGMGPRIKVGIGYKF